MKITIPLAAALVTSLVITSSALAQNGDQPNILLIISDDIGMDASTDMYPGMIDDLLEQYGPDGHNHPEYQKIDGYPASLPRLSELASQGMRFTNIWAHPFCSPTRASLLTGLFAAETRVANYQDGLSQNHTSFVRNLKDAGYNTGIFGKWHIAGIGQYTGMKPKEAGFDIFQGNMHAALNTFWEWDYQVQDADSPAGEFRTEPVPERSLPGIAATTYAPVVKIADAIDWINDRDQNDPDNPWFAWVAFNLAHTTASRLPSQMIIPNRDTLDPVALAEMEGCATAGFETADLGECSGEAANRAMSNSLDTVLGHLLDTVDDIDRDTYIIYVGDNGTPMYGRPGLDFIDNMYITRTERGKGTAYEGGALVPLVVTGPGIEANTESTQFGHAADLFSTTLALAGLPIPEAVNNSDGSGQIPLEGVSLAPILFGEADTVRSPINGYVLTESHNLMTAGSRQVGARNGTHKVICFDGTDNCEFYNIAADPLEQYPLAVPESCATYSANSRPGGDDWHYCRLTDVVATRSFMR